MFENDLGTLGGSHYELAVRAEFICPFGIRQTTLPLSSDTHNYRSFDTRSSPFRIEISETAHLKANAIFKKNFAVRREKSFGLGIHFAFYQSALSKRNELVH
jgi:hypothetical protein